MGIRWAAWWHCRGRNGVGRERCTGEACGGLRASSTSSNGTAWAAVKSLGLERTQPAHFG
jgi:hypothetical protein